MPGTALTGTAAVAFTGRSPHGSAPHSRLLTRVAASAPDRDGLLLLPQLGPRPPEELP